ncbi:MAG TPA: hypothetical protein VJ732_06745 [Bryobacteraceae bacterium]|nr:hypothetical protein [Bryobacteraceae bacterium]
MKTRWSVAPGRTPTISPVPFNAAGRAKALSYSQSQLSMPERICAFYSQWHLMLGPFGLKIWNEADPLTGKTLAWIVGGWEDRAPAFGRRRVDRDDHPHGLRVRAPRCIRDCGGPRARQN